MARTLAIGVIGVGVMGGAIARRLLACGHRVHVHDTDEARTGDLVAAGATAEPSPARVTAKVDYVITSLNSAAIVEGVVFGERGIAASASPAKLLIDMSSIDPGRTRAMATRLGRDTGMAWVDAPLSGGAPAARDGRLTLMVGGREEDIARARIPLADLAANITHMGDVGAGQATKLINQVLCACNFLAVAEATRLALDSGLEPAKVAEALAGGRADSRIMREFMPKMGAFDMTPTGRIDNMLKDLETIEAYASSSKTPMPVTGLVTQLHRVLCAAGLGPEDSVAYMRLFSFGSLPGARGSKSAE